MTEDEGFVCIFACGENKGSAPSSRRRQRSFALHLIFRIPPESDAKKVPATNVVGTFLAEDEGFEPPHTESESGVLPLH